MEKNMIPLVSIIIPCYNAGIYINEAIKSVEKQTFTDWEIIIVDDGSTDNTHEFLKSIVSKKIHIIFQENKGPANARNTGIFAASGEFILPLDADDKIAPTYLEKAIPFFSQNPELGIVYCRADKFGCETGEWYLPDFSEKEMAIDNIIFCSAFFRKKDWILVGGYPEYCRAGMEDYGFWLRLLRLGRQVIKIDEILFHYRILPESRTSKFIKDKSAIIRTYAEIFRDNIDFFSKHAEEIYNARFNKKNLFDILSTALRQRGLIWTLKKIIKRLFDIKFCIMFM